VWHIKRVLTAQFLPKANLPLGQGDNHIKTIPKDLDSAHQDGLSLEIEELLGQLCAKPCATATSHYNRYRSHFNVTIYDHKDNANRQKVQKRITQQPKLTPS
jgi:hypothetical protein